MEERFRNLDYQNWKPVRTLGTDSYGTVYEIARDDGFGMVDHAALKVLSIPAAPEDFDALVAEGRTPEEVTTLLHRQVETIARQLMAVDAISDEPNLLRCEDHVIRAHPDGRGWDIYVRTELLPSLPDYLRNHPHGEADIIRLGARSVQRAGDVPSPRHRARRYQAAQRLCRRRQLQRAGHV